MGETLLLLPEACKVMDEVGVDVPGLAEIAEFHLFDQKEDIKFTEFLELALQLRGSNVVCVRDLVNLRKFICEEIGQVEDRLMHALHGKNSEQMPRSGSKQMSRRTQFSRYTRLERRSST